MLNRRRLIIEWINSKFSLVKLKKDMFFKRKSTITAADSDDLSAKKVIETSIKSPAISVPSSIAESDRVIDASTDADFNTASSTETSSARTLGMSRRFSLISYIIGQLKMNRNISTASSADVVDKNSSDITVSTTTQSISAAQANEIHAYGAMCRDMSANELDATMLSAGAANANTSKNDKTERLAILCCWDYPTLIDGVLCISQANTINYENEILEVI